MRRRIAVRTCEHLDDAAFVFDPVKRPEFPLVLRHRLDHLRVALRAADLAVDLRAAHATTAFTRTCCKLLVEKWQKLGKKSA